MDNQIKTNVPNGGWGWMVVAAVAFINMTNQSIASVFGLLFGGQLLAMNKDTSTAALITNLNCLALNLSGLFIGPVIKSFSPRKVAAAGCIFTTSGLVLCAYSSEVWHFIIGYSLICGIGQGLIAPSTFMAINSYFTTKRGRAVGISLAGSGLGQMLVPHIVRVFLDNYGFRGAVLSMAGFALNGLIGVYMFRPLKQTAEPRRNNQRDRNLLMQSDKDGKQISEIKIIPADAVAVDTTHQSKTKKLCNKIFHRLVQAMDLELLRDPVFWSIFIGLALVYTSTTNFTMLFPYFLQSHVGLSRPDTALCMSVVAGADICSRLLLPFITDKLKVPYRVVFLFGTVGLLISRSALAESSTLMNIIVMSAFTGMSKSATVVNNNLSVSSYCRPEKLPGALGLNMIAKAILVVSLGQILGLIRDVTGSYVIGLHSQNILLVVVILFWTPEILYRYCKNRDKCKSSSSTEGNEEEHTKMNEQNAC